MSDVIGIKDRKPFEGTGGSGSGSGSGPEDPMLEQRVDRLEKILIDLEPKITEILLTGAKQADLHRLEMKVADCAKQIDLQKAQADLADLKGRVVGIDGRIVGLDARIAALPTTWTILSIVFTTWALGSGILIFAMNFLKR